MQLGSIKLAVAAVVFVGNMLQSLHSFKGRQMFESEFSSLAGMPEVARWALIATDSTLQKNSIARHAWHA